jgi:serralysin
VAGLKYQVLGSAAGEVALGTGQNDFFNLLGGDDAVDGGEGNDVLDGGIGSNFLTGGAGVDTFFLDGRGGTTTWSTITDWQVGEQLSLFGWRPGVSQVLWLDQDGAAGFQGVTMHADLDGNGLIETSVTWTGKTHAELPVPLEYDGLLWFV